MSAAGRQLCNECHTSDNYELNRGIASGSILYNWELQQSAFLKRTIGVKQARFMALWGVVPSLAP